MAHVVISSLRSCDYCPVRQKVKDLVSLLQDDSRLREERRKAKQTKDKYTGVSSDDSMGSRYSAYQWFVVGRGRTEL